MKRAAWIPLEPVAQGRPRAVVRGQVARLVDPPKSRKWKAQAAKILRAAVGAAPPLEGPLEAHLLFLFPCPQSRHRKRQPARSQPRAGRPDLDNLVKAALDAAQGILFLDDAQVVRIIAEKHDAAQGQDPGVDVVVYQLQQLEGDAGVEDSSSPAPGP